MKRAKPYRNWLVWWLQQKRKERNGSTGAWYSTIAGILGFYEGTKYTDIDLDNDGSDDSGLLSSVGSSNAPVLKSQSHLYGGSAYIVLPSAVTLSGDFEITASGIVSDLTSDQRCIIGNGASPNNQVRIMDGTGLFRVNIAGTDYDFNSLTATVGTAYTFTVTRSGSTLTGNLDGTTQDLSCNTSDMSLNWIGSRESGIDKYIGNLWDLKIYDSSGNVVLDCPGTNAVGTSIPMLINGSLAYGTLTGATLPDFYAEHQDGLSGYNPNVLGYSARENLVKYSEDFSSDTYWTKFGTATVTGTNVHNLPAVNDRIYQAAGHRPTVSAGDEITLTAVLSGVAGTTISLVPTGIVAEAWESVVLTAEPTTYQLTGIHAAGGSLAGFIQNYTNDTATQVTVHSIQFTVNKTTEYVKTTDTPIQGIQPAPGYDVSGDGVEILTNPSKIESGDATATWDEGTRVGRIVTDDSDYAALTVVGGLVVGNRYLCVYTSIAETLGTIKLSSCVEGNANRTLSGAETFEFVASNVTLQVGRATYPTDVTFSISVQEIQITPNYNKDILGNTLQYPKPKLSSKYTGYTGAWDGTAYGELDSTVTLSGDFKVEWGGSSITDGALMGSSGSTDYVIFSSSGASTRVKLNGVTSSESSISTNGGGSFERSGTDGIFSDGTNSATVTVDAGDVSFSQIMRYSSGSIPTSGELYWLKIYNSDGTLIHHWVCESSSTSEQGIIYDVVGDNHATLTSATLPFFTTESEEATYLLNGWRSGENLLTYSEELTNSAWNDRGTITVTDDAADGPIAGTRATKLENVASLAAADIYQISPASFSGGEALYPEIWIKRISTSGEIAVKNSAAAANKGRTTVDLSAIGDGWVKLSDVGTVTDAWVANGSSDGLHILRYSGTDPLDIYVYAPQLSTIDGVDYIVTTDASVPFSYIPAKAGEVEWTSDGVDLGTNMDFSAWTGDNPDSWTVNNEDANNYVTEHPDGLRIVSDYSSPVALAQVVGTIGKSYRVTFKKSSHVSGYIRFLDPVTITWSNLPGTDSDGVFTFDYYSVAVDSINISRSTETTDYVLEYVSVQLLESSLASASGSALGQPLTVGPSDLRTFEPGYIEMPQDKRLLNADVVSQYEGTNTSLTDPSFNDDTKWYNGDPTAATITGGQLIVDGSQAANFFLRANLPASVVVGDVYKIVVDVDAMGASAECFDIRVGYGNITKRFRGTDGAGVHTEYLTIADAASFADKFYVLAYGGSADKTFTLNSVNIYKLQDPLNVFFEPDGDPRQIEYEDLLPTYGAELVTNGGFDADTDWTKGTDWVISGGVASKATTTASGLIQTCLTVGKTYQVSADIVSNGSINVYGGTKPYDFVTNEFSGSKTVIITAETHGQLQFYGAGVVTSLDNVTVKEITATGATTNDQYFFSDYGLVICDAPQDEEAIETIEHQLGL